MFDRCDATAASRNHSQTKRCGTSTAAHLYRNLLTNVCQNQMASRVCNSGFGCKQKQLIKVSIVDDEEVDRLLLERILEESAGFTCASMHSSSGEALHLIPKLDPNLVFVDIRMPGMDGLECTRRLKVLMPRLKVIIVTGMLDVDTMNKSFEAGADNYLTKPIVAAHCLAMLIFTVRSGIPSTKYPCPVLTMRENEVLALLERGYLYKEIADNLGISSYAVHFHLHNSYQKLHAANRTEAIIRWRARDPA